MQKFGRNFRITIDPADGLPPIVITLPFTIQFWMQRDTMADLNRLSIDVYNLSEANRSRIFQDRFDLSSYRTLIFEAGYTTLYRIFQGRIYEASSAREGVNIVTRIEARDGQYDIAASQVFTTLQAGQTVGDILKFLVGQLPKAKLGAIGDWGDTPLQKPVVLNGNTWDLLKQYSNGQVYIDNGRVYLLQKNEVLAGEATLINDATGLLQTPRRDEGFLTITTLLETGVGINQLITLQSTINPIYNGTYAVCGVHHQGVISSAVNGPARTVFNLLAPVAFQTGKPNNNTFKQVQPVTG